MRPRHQAEVLGPRGQQRRQVGPHRPLRGHRRLVDQHRQRLLRRPAVRPLDLARLRRRRVRPAAAPGHPRGADRGRRARPRGPRRLRRLAGLRPQVGGRAPWASNDRVTSPARLLGAGDVRALAAELDLRPTKRLGQNFVHDANTVRRIVRLAEVGADDVVLEVGPGLGSLTLPLLEAARAVVAVEIDPVLADRLPATAAERAPGRDLRVVTADALRLGARRPPARARTSLVANLPYNVAVPVVLNLLAALPGAAPRAGHGAGRGRRAARGPARRARLRRAVGQARLVRRRAAGGPGPARGVLAGPRRRLGPRRRSPATTGRTAPTPAAPPRGRLRRRRRRLRPAPEVAAGRARGVGGLGAGGGGGAAGRRGRSGRARGGAGRGRVHRDRPRGPARPRLPEAGRARSVPWTGALRRRTAGHRPRPGQDQPAPGRGRSPTRRLPRPRHRLPGPEHHRRGVRDRRGPGRHRARRDGLRRSTASTPSDVPADTTNLAWRAVEALARRADRTPRRPHRSAQGDPGRGRHGGRQRRRRRRAAGDLLALAARPGARRPHGGRGRGRLRRRLRPARRHRARHRARRAARPGALAPHVPLGGRGRRPRPVHPHRLRRARPPARPARGAPRASGTSSPSSRRWPPGRHARWRCCSATTCRPRP